MVKLAISYRYFPEDTRKKLPELCNNDKGTDRVICDYVAGMTDEYACRIYQMVFLPGHGSVFNRL